VNKPRGYFKILNAGVLKVGIKPESTRREKIETAV
jgi:hypothetical protein